MTDLLTLASRKALNEAQYRYFIAPKGQRESRLKILQSKCRADLEYGLVKPKRKSKSSTSLPERRAG